MRSLVPAVLLLSLAGCTLPAPGHDCLPLCGDVPAWSIPECDGPPHCVADPLAKASCTVLQERLHRDICVDSRLVAFAQEQACNAHIVDGKGPTCVGPLGSSYDAANTCDRCRNLQVAGSFTTVAAVEPDQVRVHGQATDVRLGGRTHLAAFVGTAASIEARAEGHGIAVVLATADSVLVVGDGGGGAAAAFAGTARKLDLNAGREDESILAQDFEGSAVLDRRGAEVRARAGFLEASASLVEVEGAFGRAELTADGNGGSTVTLRGAAGHLVASGTGVTVVGRLGNATIKADGHGGSRATLSVEPVGTPTYDVEGVYVDLDLQLGDLGLEVKGKNVPQRVDDALNMTSGAPGSLLLRSAGFDRAQPHVSVTADARFLAIGPCKGHHCPVVP